MEGIATDSLGWGAILLLFAWGLARATPGILAAWTKLIDARASAKLAEGEADKKRGDAVLADAQARMIDAQARKLEAETTGKFSTDALDRVQELERNVADLRAELAKRDSAIAARDALVTQLQLDIRDLRRDIAAGGPGALLAHLLDAVRRLQSEMQASGVHMAPPIAEAWRLVDDAARAAERMVA